MQRRTLKRVDTIRITTTERDAKRRVKSLKAQGIKANSRKIPGSKNYKVTYKKVHYGRGKGPRI